MSYAKWESEKNLKENLRLEKVNKKTKPSHIGLPIMYDKDFLYVDSRLNHSLVIGSRGSGKSQTVTLPMLKLASLSGESIVIHDSTNELYETTKKHFEENDYKIIKINFDNLKDSNCWNPFTLVSKVYKNGDEDKAQELIENIGYSLLVQKEEANSDPFWINSAVNYFTGIMLYAIKNNENINFNDLISINQEVQQYPKEFIEKIDKNSNIYLNLVGILTAPSDTRNSIFAVFNQKIKEYFSKQNLLDMMSKSDFDIENISNQKTVVYIVSGNSDSAKSLIPLFINQVYYAKNEVGNNNRLNIVIGDFYKLNPIRDFAKTLDYSLNIGIKFTIIIRGFNDLKNAYGKEYTEIIKMCFTNIMYLLSTDLETLEEISNLCGNNGKEPLISAQELKTLKMFEGIYITTRVMPCKTNLLPFYEMENR